MWTVSWFRSLVERSVTRVGGGLMALMDWLVPTDAPHRRGAQLGFDGTQGRAHIYRSIPEGTALTMVGHVTAVESAIGRHLSRRSSCREAGRARM